MILKNISEYSITITVNSVKVEIPAWTQFSISDKIWEQLTNMYPNILSEQVILDFQRPLELEVDEESSEISTEWTYEWQFWVLENELYCYLNETWSKIAIAESEIDDWWNWWWGE